MCNPHFFALWLWSCNIFFKKKCNNNNNNNKKPKKKDSQRLELRLKKKRKSSTLSPRSRDAHSKKLASELG